MGTKATNCQKGVWLPLREGGQLAPQNSMHSHPSQTAQAIDVLLGMQVGTDTGDNVLGPVRHRHFWGRGQTPQFWGAHRALCPNGWMDCDAFGKGIGKAVSPSLSVRNARVLCKNADRDTVYIIQHLNIGLRTH